MICQVLRCKKQESKDHVGTLCKKHAEKLEWYWRNRGHDPFEYKVINEKNSVWEEGIEHIRQILTSDLKKSIKLKQEKKKRLEEMIELTNEQIKIVNRQIEDDQKTLNSRYVK